MKTRQKCTARSGSAQCPLRRFGDHYSGAMMGFGACLYGAMAALAQIENRKKQQSFLRNLRHHCVKKFHQCSFPDESSSFNSVELACAIRD